MVSLLCILVGFLIMIGCSVAVHHIIFEWIKVDWLELVGAVLLGALCATGILAGLLIVIGALVDEVAP